MEQKNEDLPEKQLAPIKDRLISIKSLSSAFYKQIIYEEIIDSTTGVLRGTPLGWVNVHNGNCSSVPHYHVLWAKADSSLRECEVYQSWQKNDSRYRRERTRRIKHRNTLGDLLALLLAPSHRYDIDSEQVRDNPDVLSIQTPIFVYGNARVSLFWLERAREQLSYDKKQWEMWACQWNEMDGQPNGGWNLEQDEQTALSMLQQLSALGVQLAHPALYKQMEASQRFAHFTEDCWEYALTDGYEVRTLTWERVPVQRMRAISRSYDPPLRWHIEESDKQGNLPSLIKMMTAGYVRSLRIVLASQVIETALQRAERSAFQLATSCNFLPVGANQGENASVVPDHLPIPADVYQAYVRAARSLEEYTEQWNCSCEKISPNVLEQLFVGGLSRK